MVMLIAGLGLAGLFYFLGRGSMSEVVWLSPAQLAKNARPGPITQLKYRLLRLSAPLWGRFRPSRRQILLSSSFMRLPVSAEDGSRLPAAMSTNSDGTRVWIVSPIDLKALQARLIPAGGIAPPSGPRISTGEGVRAQLFSGGVPPIGTNAGSPSLSIDVLPRITGSFIRLTVGITSTEFLPAPENAVRDVRTNISAACRLLVPNGGGLVLATVHTNDLFPAGYWVILTPTAVDSRGNLLKL